MVSWMMTIKAVLISSGVASMALLLKVSVPLAVEFSVSRAPILWSSFASWLKPPYLYVVTNGIIITIVASSKYYRSYREEDDEIVYVGDDDGEYKIETEPIVHDEGGKDLDPDTHFGYVEELEPEVVTAVVYDDDVAEEEEIVDTVAMAEEEEIVDKVAMAEDESELKSVIMVENSDLVKSVVEDDAISLSEVSNRKQLPVRMTESENLPPMEKPLVSSRLRNRKPMKANPEASLRVTKPSKKNNNNDTLENTWKMITEGKSTPLTRQLYRRSDTFSRGDSGGETAKPVVYKKSETFKDRTNYYGEREKVKMRRREPSLSQDELNRRAEEFIKKINEEMKLQRMESLKQYQQITNRGL